MSLRKFRICKFCGAECSTSINARCKACGKYRRHGVCKECGVYSEDIIAGMGSQRDWGKCRTCFNKALSKQVRGVDIKRRKEATDKYAAWLAAIKQLPFQPLTEDDWLASTRYFNGCAACSGEHVVTRGFFILASEGGKYVPWNVIPLCESCALALHQLKNPFAYLDPRVNDALYGKAKGDSLMRLNNIVEYLGGRMPSEQK